MLVQQDLINNFYKELEESFQYLTDEKALIERKDSAFLKDRPESDNLNISHWIDVISMRMNLKAYVFTEESPFISYNSNRAWLRLAYDIAKLISKDYSEFRVNWLKILYPNLIFEIFAGRSVHLDPIFFSPSFEGGIAKVYVVKNLPKFITHSDIQKITPVLEEILEGNVKDYFSKRKDGISYEHKTTKIEKLHRLSAPGIVQTNHTGVGFRNILRQYYLEFHESYFYVTTSNKLYYIYADGYAEDVCIKNSQLFQEELTKLLETPGPIKLDPMQISEERFIALTRLKTVSKDDLEKLIVECGGYPNLDLRSYYINDYRNKLFSIRSFLYPRDVQLEGIRTKTMFRLSHLKYRSNYKELDEYSDILPHVIFDDLKIQNPRPLSLSEFAGLRQKLDNKPYTNGQKIFTLSRRFIIEIFNQKWFSARISIPRNLIVDLIKVLSKFFNIRSFDDFIAWKKLLNDWSKLSLQNNFQDIFSFYKQDFQKLLDNKQYLYLSSKCEANVNNVFWFSNGIREIYKLYSTGINIRLKNNRQYYLFDLLNNIMLSNNHKHDILNVMAILEHFLLVCPDKLHLLTGLNFYKEIKALIVNKTKLIEEFKLILIDADKENKAEIEYVIKYLETAKIDQEISYRYKRKIATIFSRHDSQVKFSENDHNKTPTPENIRWIRLAKLLTAMGYFDDYFKLLCPGLDSYVDRVTGRAFSDCDLRDFIFSHDRKYLINISHSRSMYKILGIGFDCNSPKLRYLGYEDVKQIKDSPSKFNGFYKELSKQNLDKPIFNFRIIIGLHRLVTATTFPKKTDKNHYSFIIVDKESDLTDNSSAGLLRYFYKNVIGEKYIKVFSDEEGIFCNIDYNDPLQTNVNCKIYKHEFSKKLPKKLTFINFKPYESELIYLLRKKFLLPLEYGEENENIIDREYQIFTGLYKNLNIVERNLLNSMVISCNHEQVYFKDIYVSARYDLVKANLYFINLLRNIYPRVTFNSQIIYNYCLIPNPFKSTQSQYLAFKDPTIEIDKLFVSFMTHGYVIEGSMPSDYRQHNFLDTPFIYPTHQILYWLSNSFTRYYISINDPAVPFDEKIEYLNDIFTRFLYVNIDECDTKNLSGTYFHEVNNWITKVINGEVFKFIHLFELDEIFDIICLIQESEEYFLEHTAKYISDFMEDIRMLYTLNSGFTRAIANIKLIKLFSLLNRYDIKLKSDLDTVMSQPNTIYLANDRKYVIHYGNNVIKDGILPQYAMRLVHLDKQINEIEFKKRIWSLVSKQGDISLAENDFVIIFSLIFNHKTLKIYAKNLLKLFLVSQEIEEVDEYKFKKAVIKIFDLDEDLIFGGSGIGFFKDFNTDEHFERIAEQIARIAKQDSFKTNSIRAMSPLAGGCQF